MLNDDFHHISIMKTLLKYTEELRAKGEKAFSIADAIGALNSSKGKVLAAAYRLRKQGRLISPARGFYVVIPPEHQALGSIPAAELVPLLMEHLSIEYYAGLLTAAHYHGASHQKPQLFQVITKKRGMKPLKFGKILIDIIYKKNIQTVPYKNIVVPTGYLKISTPEVTAMDLLCYLHKSGGLNHVATVLSELITSIDPEQLILIAIQSNKKVWLQRLGYILEKIDPIDNEAKDKILSVLEEYLNTIKLTYAPLAPELPKVGCSRARKWMIIENTTVESDI